MIEVTKNLFVGSKNDEAQIRGQAGWFVIHACKDPYHRKALGYTTPGAPKDHPEYLIARRDGGLILNLIDAKAIGFVAPEIIDAAVEAIHSNIGSQKVLVHCNQGMSRSPVIAFLYLAKFVTTFQAKTYEEAVLIFRGLYPPYNPALGMSEYARQNWSRYSPGA